MKKIAVINDLSGFGRCSLTAAIPVISVLGAQCCPIATAVLSNQTGYNEYYCRDLTADMPKIIDGMKRLKPHFDGILTGFISNAVQGKIILDFIDDFKADDVLIVVDPVMADDGQLYDCYDDECVNAIKSIAKRAHIITPNLTELCIICDEDYNIVNSLSDRNKLTAVQLMCENINRKSENGVNIVVSGIHLDGDFIANAVFESGAFDVIKTKASGGSFSGTGDILSSIVTAKCVKGESLYNAVQTAVNFISRAIEKTIRCADDDYIPADGIYFENFLADLGEKDER